jgi:hypothetical protein
MFCLLTAYGEVRTLRILPFPLSNGNAVCWVSNAASIFPTCAEVKFPQVVGFDDRPAPQRSRWRGRPGLISDDLISLLPLFSSAGNFGIGLSISEQSLKTASTLLCGDVGAFSITLGENGENMVDKLICG